MSRDLMSDYHSGRFDVAVSGVTDFAISAMRASNIVLNCSRRASLTPADVNLMLSDAERLEKAAATLREAAALAKPVLHLVAAE